MGEWIKSQARYQMAPMDSVKSEYRWSDKDRCFYLNSAAGLIRYKPKNLADLTRFRNEWINKFETMIQNKCTPRELFQFYKELRRAEDVSFKANLRTRLKGMLP